MATKKRKSLQQNTVSDRQRRKRDRKTATRIHTGRGTMNNELEKRVLKMPL